MKAANRMATRDRYGVSVQHTSKPTGTGRFAPSPSGPLHLGNLRTALAAWLDARANGHRFLIRIDDLDPDRSRPEYADAQLRDLEAIGIDWDEPPVSQRARRDRHEWALAELAQLDDIYPCFCSRAEIRAAATAPHGPGPDLPYPGTCAALAPRTAERRIAAGDPHSMRARTNGATVAIDDELLGTVSLELDDFVVRRRDGVPAYNLASPVDEADLGVDIVIRGSDLAPNTPRQSWLAQRLELAEPRYAHIPLVVGADGERLAKRHGAVTLDDARALGIDEAAVVRLLARSLGIAPEAAAAAHRASDLVSAYDRAHIPRSSYILDLSPLGA